jgi:hypothetical protein
MPSEGYKPVVGPSLRPPRTKLHSQRHQPGAQCLHHSREGGERRGVTAYQRLALDEEFDRNHHDRRQCLLCLGISDYPRGRYHSGWTKADDEAIQPIYADFMRRTSEQLGTPTAEDETYLSRARELMESFWDARPDLVELRARNDKRLACRDTSQRDFLSETRRALVDCAASAR